MMIKDEFGSTSLDEIANDLLTRGDIKMENKFIGRCAMIDYERFLAVRANLIEPSPLIRRRAIGEIAEVRANTR